MPAIASKAYKAGDVIFECNPIIHCIENKFKGKHCDNCLKKSDSLKRCSKCLKMYYCHRNCQQNDWKYHKNECKIFNSHEILNGKFCTTVLLRIILRLWFCMQSDPNFASKRYPLFDGPDICLNEIKGETELLKIIPKEKDYFEAVCTNFKVWGIDFDREELLRCYGLVDISTLYALNYYTDSLSELQFYLYQDRVASAIFLNKPDLTHSCLPNAGLLKNGLTYQYRAMKDIAMGEEITEAFAELGQPQALRHKQLVANNYTVCHCDKCRLNLDKDIDYKEFNRLATTNDQSISLIGSETLAAAYNIDYRMNDRLFRYFQEIYGPNDVYNSEKLALSFICFALYSRHSSKPLIKLWYKKIEPTLLVTHGSDHPTFKLFQNVYQKSI